MEDKSSGNKILKYLRNIKTRRSSLRLFNKIVAKLPHSLTAEDTRHPLGSFVVFSDEVLFHIFLYIPLRDLGSLALSSRLIRDKLITFHFSKQALVALKPRIFEQKEGKKDTVKEKEYSNHFLNLGKLL